MGIFHIFIYQLYFHNVLIFVAKGMLECQHFHIAVLELILKLAC